MHQVVALRLLLLLLLLFRLLLRLTLRMPLLILLDDVRVSRAW